MIMTIAFRCRRFCLVSLLALSLLAVMPATTTAFCPPVPFAGVTTTTGTSTKAAATLARRILPQQGNAVFWKSANSPNRRLVGPTRTMRSNTSSSSLVRLQGGLFGLGFAELGIIGIALFFVLGPKNIGKLVRASGERAADISDELKRVPEEFAKGMDEGESTARARKARPIRRVVVDDKDNEE